MKVEVSEFRDGGWCLTINGRDLVFATGACVKEDPDYREEELIVRSVADRLNNVEHWNTAAHLPTPNVPLIIMLSDGTVVKGIRPAYISSREEGDLGYRDLEDNVLLEVVKWTIA